MRQAELELAAGDEAAAATLLERARILIAERGDGAPVVPRLFVATLTAEMCLRAAKHHCGDALLLMAA